MSCGIGRVLFGQRLETKPWKQNVNDYERVAPADANRAVGSCHGTKENDLVMANAVYQQCRGRTDADKTRPTRAADKFDGKRACSILFVNKETVIVTRQNAVYSTRHANAPACNRRMCPRNEEVALCLGLCRKISWRVFSGYCCWGNNAAHLQHL